MGKLFDRLEKQLQTEFRQDAEDCIKIYNKLKDMSNGHVWESNWNPLVRTEFEGFNKRRFKPSSLGYVFLKGIENDKNH